MNLTGEQRLLICAILLAVAEQDTRFVTWGVKYKDAAHRERIKLLKRREAHEYVQSEEFTHLCLVTNLDADRMRMLDPEKAHKLFIKLMDPRKDN